MKVFLRHVRTGHYYRGNCKWAAAKVDAGEFDSIENALQVSPRDRLYGMSVVIQYDDGEQVFDLSSGQRSGAEPPAYLKEVAFVAADHFDPLPRIHGLRTQPVTQLAAG